MYASPQVCVSACLLVWMDGSMEAWMQVRADGWTDGPDGCIDGPMDRGMMMYDDECMLGVPCAKRAGFEHKNLGDTARAAFAFA